MFVCKVSGYGFECSSSHLNFYFKCDCASNFWQQIELASVIESDLGDDVVFHKKWLVDFYAGETLHVSPITPYMVLLISKCMCLFLVKKHILR